MAEHWIAHGQTTINSNSSIDDPTPNQPGTDGEIVSLPYTVPAGKRLMLVAQGVEGTREPLSALFPWLGDYTAGMTVAQQTAYRKANSLFTVQSMGGSLEDGRQRFILPAGTVLHVRLVNGTATTYTLAWYIRGLLLDNGEDASFWL